MSKQEREEARRRWLQEQKHRKWVKTELTRLKNQPISSEQIEELAIPLPPSPLGEFFEGFVELPDVDIGAVYRRELIDLVASNTLLDRETRAAIASELRRFYLPDKQRKQYDRTTKLRVEIRMMRWLKRHYEPPHDRRRLGQETWPRSARGDFIGQKTNNLSHDTQSVVIIMASIVHFSQGRCSDVRPRQNPRSPPRRHRS